MSRAFAALFCDVPLPALFANMNARAEELDTGSLNIPCTVIDRVQPNCYTASPHAAIVDYAKDELVKLPPLRRMAAAGLLAGLGGILRANQIDRMATLNNYCLSTNSFSHGFQAASMADLTDAAVQKWPQHALSIRSLNVRQHADLIARLERLGWQMVVSRQVYIIDDWPHAFAKANTKRDRKLLHDGRYVFERLGVGSPDADFQVALYCYNRLYLHKYSKQNVQFTTRFLREAAARGILELYLLRDAETGKGAGVSGIVKDSDTATAPIVGYDDTVPQSEGLYRRCMAQSMQAAHEAGLTLNFSSGAPDFKKVRGAVPAIEYMAVYTRHLPPPRRPIWALLHKISHAFYKKTLLKYGL
ncbi:GNAT family N-acetyltransferase [Eikenella glucosivorans]|uniref:GNAT family N-acetyltransferase n=1 Tax=Eikenella glucosivorans TaxID=2766967 RepID=UPI001EE56283|nr:GNAT family N-acetyltransferase [Eikenella glucosivorans]